MKEGYELGEKVGIEIGDVKNIVQLKLIKRICYQRLVLIYLVQGTVRQRIQDKGLDQTLNYCG